MEDIEFTGSFYKALYIALQVIKKTIQYMCLQFLQYETKVTYMVSKTCSVRPYSTKKSKKFYNNVGINCYPHFTSYTTSPAPICTSVHEIKWNQWSYKQIGLNIVLQFSFWEFFNEISFIYRYTWSIIYVVCINLIVCLYTHTMVWLT